MHRYFIKTPWFIRKIFSSYEWKISTAEKTLYLSFDDGPHPEITPWVLNQLREYNAKASFFCIGRNVQEHPGIYQQIIDEGHAVGNHTQDHLNGWTTDTKLYLSNVSEAAKIIHSQLFRPPYGRIRKSQSKNIPAALHQNRSRIIMWDVLSGDFDASYTPVQCFDHVRRNASAGSIIVFHDSEKAYSNLNYALPAVLKYFSEKGYHFNRID
jgi:peptidoglycan/xylan/chitin deacetylase (PgdA/CDA1 family)